MAKENLFSNLDDVESQSIVQVAIMVWLVNVYNTVKYATFRVNLE